METSSITGLAVAILISLIHQGLAGTIYGDYDSKAYPDVYGPQVTAKTIKKGNSGKCLYSLIGIGVDDEIEDDCREDFTLIHSPKHFTYYYKNHRPFTLFHDTFGTLVIINSSGCRLRTYQPAPWKITYAESVLTNEICDKVKKYVDNEIKRINEYRRKMEGFFQKRMKWFLPASFRPVDPLKNQPWTPSLYADEPRGPMTLYSVPEQTPQPLLPSLLKRPPSLLTKIGSPNGLGMTFIESDRESTLILPKYKTTSNVFNNDNKCIVEQCVKGNGVSDCFKTPCSDKATLPITLGVLIVWGNPGSFPFAIFSDERATLYLFENEWCTKKTYVSSGRMTTSKAELLTSKDCEEVIKRLDSNLKERGFLVNPRKPTSMGNPIPVYSSGAIVNPATGVFPSQPLS